MMRRTISTALVAALLLLFTPSGKADPNLVGQWQGPAVAFEIRADGSYIWNAPPTVLQGNAMVQDGVLRFVVLNVPQQFFVDYRYAIQGNQLQLQDVGGNMFSFLRVGAAGRQSTGARGRVTGASRQVGPATRRTPPGGQPNPGAATRQQKLAFLELVKSYPQMQPDAVLQAYRSIHPDQLMTLQVFDALHRDITERACGSAAAQQMVFQGMGVQWNCAEQIRSKMEARQMVESMGMAYDGNRTTIESNRVSVQLSLECDLGITDRSQCRNWNTMQQNMATDRHVTNMNIIENMGPERRYEWKTVPGGR